MSPDQALFTTLVSKKIKMNPVSSDTPTWGRKMKSFFGVGMSVLLEIWKLIAEDNPDNQPPVDPNYFLMGLYFLKIYPKDSVGSCVFDVQEKTWRKWTCTVVELISKLELVYFNSYVLFNLILHLRFILRIDG
jgi:hypothetical protein